MHPDLNEPANEPEGWPVPDGTTLVSEHETVVAPPAPAGPPLDRRIGAGMLLGLGALVLVALGLVIAWVLTHRTTPHTGTTVVITTAPLTTAATTATTGSAQAPAGKAVPVLAGLKLADAQARLSSLGLRATTTPVTSSGRAPGTVVDQAPKPGTRLAKGSNVTLSVAKAPAGAANGSTTTAASLTTAATTAPATAPAQPQAVTVPAVQGQEEAGAVQSLGRAGILASLAFVPGSDPLGTVLQQAKPPGTTLPYHAHMQINISRGPSDNPLQRVPNVIGTSLQDALAALQGANLRLIYLKFPVTSRAQAGKIVQQSPLGGARAPQNAQVLVFLGAYRAG